MELEKAVIYIDLDSLFDTRMATLLKLGADKIEKNIPHGYYERHADSFIDVADEDFAKAYQARDEETLRLAVITPVMGHVCDFIRRTNVATTTTPFERDPKVIINTYPYQLSDVMISSIVEGVKIVTKGSADIEAQSLSFEALTPSYIKKNFVQMVMYHYAHWAEVNLANESLLKEQCSMVQLVGPMLMKSKEAVKEMSGVNVYAATQNYFRPFINLTLFPVNFFCADMNRMKAMVKKENGK